MVEKVTIRKEISPEKRFKSDLVNPKKRMRKETELEIDVDGLAKISKEVKHAAVLMTRDQLRFMVDAYKQAQDDRIAKDNQVRSVVQMYDDGTLPNNLAIYWLAENRRNEENQIKKILEQYVKKDPVGSWIISNVGVGPVFAAEFLAYLDITKVTHAGQFLSYCGLNDYANPYYGKEKANILTRFVYKINNLFSDIFYDILKTKAKGFDLKASDIKEIYDLFNKKLNSIEEWDTALQLDDDYLDPKEDKNIIDVIKAIKKKKKYTEFIMSVYDDFESIVYDYQDKFNDEINKIKEELEKEMVPIDIEDKSVIDDIDDTDVFIDKEKGTILPRYLNGLYRYLDSATLPDTLTSDKYASWLRNSFNTSTVTPEIVNIFSVVTGRHSKVVWNGLKGLKKKEDENTTKYFTKSDFAKYAAKPPYNANLKKICWQLGDSFLKQRNRKKSLYGGLFNDRIEYETRKNMNRDYSYQAVMAVSMKQYNHKTSAYQSYAKGMLPDAHILARSKRFVARIFIVHLFEIMWINQYGTAPEKFFPLEHLGHTDYIAPEVPYDEFVKVPREYYEQYKGYNIVTSLKDAYKLN